MSARRTSSTSRSRRRGPPARASAAVVSSPPSWSRPGRAAAADAAAERDTRDAFARGPGAALPARRRRGGAGRRHPRRARSTAVVAALLINYYFVAPRHTLDVAHADQVVALVVFVAVAAIVSGAVEVAARRARAAEQRARAGRDAFRARRAPTTRTSRACTRCCASARDTFAMETVTLKLRAGAANGATSSTSGWAAPGKEAPMRFDVPIGGVCGWSGAARHCSPRTSACCRRSPAPRRRPTRAAAHRAGARGRDLAAVDRQRTALLAAVGPRPAHSARRRSRRRSSTLRQTDVAWSEAERDELLATIEDVGRPAGAIVANLLDASRLQAGALSVRPQPVALDEVVGAALLAVPDAASDVRVDVPEDLPLSWPTPACWSGCSPTCSTTPAPRRRDGRRSR